jgi:hypothetical protein
MELLTIVFQEHVIFANCSYSKNIIVSVACQTIKPLEIGEFKNVKLSLSET